MVQIKITHFRLPDKNFYMTAINCVISERWDLEAPACAVLSQRQQMKIIEKQQ